MCIYKKKQMHERERKKTETNDRESDPNEKRHSWLQKAWNT